MSRLSAFRAAAGLALVVWLLALLWSVLVALAGVSGALGWSSYDVPGLSATTFEPTWSVQSAADIAPAQGDDYPPAGETAFRFVRQDADESTNRSATVQPVSVQLEGTARLSTPPGWDPLLVSIYAMAAASGLVLAFVLFQLWRLLRSAATGAPFTDQVVRRTRLIGLTLLGAQILEPVLWLFLSPKAHDISSESRGPLLLALGDQEPGGPTFGGVAFALLLVLLAEVFRHGAALEEERSLTV